MISIRNSEKGHKMDNFPYPTNSKFTYSHQGNISWIVESRNGYKMVEEEQRWNI